IQYKCSVCPKTLTSAHDLSLHMKVHTEQESGGDHRCDMCYKSFSQLSLLRQHQESHVGQVVYECTECDKAFAFPHLLEEHQKTHAPLKCPYCKMKFSNSEELLAHCKWHSQNPNQDSESGSKTKDNRKEATHTPLGGILKCHICGKVFPFWSGLQVHIRMHTGEKPYICKVCGKAFSNRSSIRIHEVTHWSIKPYNCTWCGKSFTQLSSAKKHPCKGLRESNDRGSRKKPFISFTLTHSHQELHHTYYPSPPLQANHPRGSHLLHYFSNHSDLLHSLSPLIPVPPPMQHPGFQPGLQLYDSTQLLTSPLSPLYSQVETIPNPDRKDGNVNRKQSRIYGNATKRAARSKEDKATMGGFISLEMAYRSTNKSGIFNTLLC
uniref:C2H2-type domain-containing protein n=1 Tax=Oncorhynchus mykiss TaxID=8022 RepID=A0A8K9UG25_ONCMY